MRKESQAMRCAAIPGRTLAAGNLEAARVELQWLCALAARRNLGLIPGPGGKPDVLANLWFARAAHEYARLAAALPPAQGRVHLEFGARMLLPMCRRIVQEFISESGMDGVRMDDGGLLTGYSSGRKRHGFVTLLRLNALWYVALELTGQALMGRAPLGVQAEAHDSFGDHFERLAGRSRRAFAKVYWCDAHARICLPETRQEPDHCGLPDAEQLLLTVLPVSPLPRTKQRQILAQVERLNLGAVGVRVAHPQYGMVESPLHLAWLAQGWAGTAESGADFHKGAVLARRLAHFWELASDGGIHAYYRDGHALPGTHIDALTTAEVLGTLQRFRGTPGERTGPCRAPGSIHFC